jgi:hypothetical protein
MQKLGHAAPENGTNCPTQVARLRGERDSSLLTVRSVHTYPASGRLCKELVELDPDDS